MLLIVAIAIGVFASYTYTYYYNKDPESSVGRFSIANISGLKNKNNVNVVQAIKDAGCFVTSYAMVLKNLGATTSSTHYDNRTSSTGYLSSDPFTVTLANMGFPSTSSNVLNSYVYPVSIQSATSIGQYFDKTFTQADLSGLSDSSKMYNIDYYYDKYPQGIILRFEHENGSKHALVVIGSTYQNHTRALSDSCISPEVNIDFSVDENEIISSSVMPRYTPTSGKINDNNGGSYFTVHDPAYYGTSSDGALTLSNSWTAQEFSWSELKYIQILK